MVAKIYGLSTKKEKTLPISPICKRLCCMFYYYYLQMYLSLVILSVTSHAEYIKYMFTCSCNTPNIQIINHIFLLFVQGCCSTTVGLKKLREKIFRILMCLLIILNLHPPNLIKKN